ncbi:MAG: ABC transporter permease, partial [Pseudomonadota bacterium]|nr:ABC transporter permease [Pseudomonadota bacterium]
MPSDVAVLATARPNTPRRVAVNRFLRRPAAVAGLVVIVLFVAVAILAPLIAPFDPVATSWSAIRKAPTA